MVLFVSHGSRGEPRMVLLVSHGSRGEPGMVLFVSRAHTDVRGEGSVCSVAGGFRSVSGRVIRGRGISARECPCDPWPGESRPVSIRVIRGRGVSVRECPCDPWPGDFGP